MKKEMEVLINIFGDIIYGASITAVIIVSMVILHRKEIIVHKD